MTVHVYPFVIKNIFQEVEGVYILILATLAENNQYSFIPGQYLYIANPSYKNPKELHPFSIASAPGSKELEFCVKIYGSWTNELIKKKPGDVLYLSHAYGNFTYSRSYSYIVFLLGGIGISPVISMLRSLRTQTTVPKVTLLYGNRTPDTIAYNKELKKLQKAVSSMKIVHIFSEIDDGNLSEGYRGFITKEIVSKEVDLSKKPVFFVVGPPIFINKMESLLADLHISDIKKEILEKQVPTEPIFSDDVLCVQTSGFFAKEK